MIQYEPGKRLPVQSQQLEHVGNMLTVTIKTLERRHYLQA